MHNKKEWLVEIFKGSKRTHRDHENDANDEALISGFSVIEEVPVNVKNGQSDGSGGAKESDDVEENRNQYPHSASVRGTGIQISKTSKP